MPCCQDVTDASSKKGVAEMKEQSLCNQTEEAILGRKTCLATNAGRRGISNGSVQTKRPTRVENGSMQTLKSKAAPTKEKISSCKPR
jgi:hypothetical protein